MLRLFREGRELAVKFFKFNGGEHQVEIQSTGFVPGVKFLIDADIRDGEIMQLALLVDAIRRHCTNAVITLTMPYVPYARQDRVMGYGQALSIKVFCDFINSLKFDSVVISDPHSDVTTALLDNVVEIKQHNLVNVISVLSEFDPQAIVSPDAGATKKAFQTANKYMISLVECQKHRCVMTGNITGVTAPKVDPSLTRLLIVDDICDGGRTFEEVAKALKEANPHIEAVGLWVTHGIFSKGKDIPYIDWVGCKYDWTMD